MISYCGFDFTPLIDYDMLETFFMDLLAICIFFLKDVNSGSQLFTGFFKILSYISSLYILNINNLESSRISRCLLSSLQASFDDKIFEFDRSHLFIFVFVFQVFERQIQKQLLKLMLKSLLNFPCF